MEAILLELVISGYLQVSDKHLGAFGIPSKLSANKNVILVVGLRLYFKEKLVEL